VALQLILFKENLKKLRIGLFMGLFNPLLEFVHIKTVLIGLERCLKRNIQYPILFLATSPNEINRFSSLKDFVGKMIGEKGRYHHVVQFVFFGPKFFITNLWVTLNEKLLIWIVDLTRQHPSLDH
jgi:hypothetical protein